VSDWFDHDHTVAELRCLVDNSQPIGIQIDAFGWIDASLIKLRQWLYKPHYIRQFVSVVISTGGTGKSSLAIVEALAMASGTPLLGIQAIKRQRVWYWNGEDPLDELHRRFAAAIKRYGLTYDDLGDRLFVSSGRARPIIIAQEDKLPAHANEAVIDGLIAVIRQHAIDVVIIDPFVSCHRVNENDNAAIERVTKAWSHIAECANCAVMLVHHSRKPNGNEITVDDGRGASALLAAARSARVINTMSSREAAVAEIPEHQRRSYFQADIGKANLTRPPEAADWFKLISVDLENGIPFGDEVGVVTAWTFPQIEQLKPSLNEIWQCQAAIRKNEACRADRRSANWVGLAIAGVLGIDPAIPRQRTKIDKLVKEWLRTGWLREEKRRDSTTRKLRPFVVVGKPAPVPDTGAPDPASTSE
jgi:hypothetical protein